MNTVVLPFHCAPRARIRKLEWLREMLISILILVVSLAALIQFAAFTWRAAFLTVATAELPEDRDKYITLNDFEEASAYERLCPELGVRVSTRLGSVSAYNSLLQFAISRTSAPVFGIVIAGVKQLVGPQGFEPWTNGL